MLSSFETFQKIAHDICNISHIFTFSFQLECRVMSIIYATIFREVSKLGSMIGEIEGRERVFIIICFNIGLLNFSLCLYSSFLLVLNN